MITNNLRYGGTLNLGDFIGIGSNYGMEFGWYIGNGSANNIQYIRPTMVNFWFSQYERRIRQAQEGIIPLDKKDSNGFNFNHLKKTALRSHKNHCAVKIENPDTIFSDTYLIEYNKAKEILTNIKFLKS